MPRKHTYEEVKQYISNNGCILLSTEYINSTSKIKIKCEQWCEYKSIFGDFKAGERCPVCYKERRDVTHSQAEEKKFCINI